jgi:hypothetical protein
MKLIYVKKKEKGSFFQLFRCLRSFSEHSKAGTIATTKIRTNRPMIARTKYRSIISHLLVYREGDILNTTMKGARLQ